MACILLSGGSVFALSSDTKKEIISEMKTYVADLQKEDGYLPLIHKGKVLRLKVKTSKKFPDGFHSGVANEGSYFTACADFVDDSGKNYDVDFLVSKVGGKYKVVQPIVHSIDGKKNPYDLGH